MAQQIKKKFIKNDAIDGSKIKLLEGQSIRIDGPAGEIELLKLGENGELLSAGQEVAFKSQVDALEAQLQTEEQERIAGDSQLATSLEAEVLRATSSEEALDSKIDQEISDRSQAMSAEESARISGDENLQNQINNILSNVDPEALDSLTEIVSAFQDADSDLQGTISALSASAASALAQEVSDRQAADQVLQSNIDAEESERIAADGVLQSNIDAEEARAMGVESDLQSQITQEISDRQSADLTLQGNIDSEESAREAGDLALQSNIDAEEARAMGVESSLQSQVTQEVADRIAGDASLQASIDDLDGYAQEIRSDLEQEILDRQSGDSSLQSNIDAEEARAMGVEASLQDQITQEVSDRENAIVSVESQLASSIASVESQIESEQLSRETADSEINTRLEVLEADPVTKSYVNGEISELSSLLELTNSSISQEVSDRQAGDADLQDQINVEKSRVDAILEASDADKDSFKEIVDLINSVDTENDQAFAGYVLSNNEAVGLKADISYVDSEVSDLQDSIGIEESARIAADSALQSQIDGLQPRVGELESAVEALQEYKEVLEFGDVSSFPEQGVPSKVYVSKDSNKIYRYEEGQESGGLELPSMPSAPELVVTTSITSADDLQATINAASDGDVIFLANGTYSLAANLSISKQVALVGESQAGVLIQDTRGNAQSFVSVSVDNVTLKDLTVRHSTTESNIGHAIVVSGPGFPQARLNNFRMYNVKSQYSKGGLSIRSNNFVVDGCTFEVVAGSSTRRGILHYGNGGNSFIKNSHFINSTTGALRAITPTATSGSNPSDDQAGSLTIEGSTFTGNLSQFVNMDNHQGAAGAFELIVKDNVTPETNAFVVSFGGVNNFGDLFSRIVLVGNTLTNNHAVGLGKGVFAIDGVSGPRPFRSSPLEVISSGNTLGQLDFRSGYAEAAGSTGSIVGYVTAQIAQPTVEISEGSSGGSSAGLYIELSPTIDQDLAGIQSAIDDEQTRAMGVESGLDSRLTTAESDINSLESRMSTAESDIDAVESRMTSAEGDIDSLEARVTENESDISVLQSQVLNVESEVSSLKTRMTTAESDISSLETAITSEVSRATSAEEALDARVNVLEAKAFGKQKIVIGEELSFIELEREVVANSLVVCVNRLSVHKDEDYVVSVVGGKTRLTWINSFANPDGEEKIEEGDSIFVTFYY
jgi:hypothetical protein